MSAFRFRLQPVLDQRRAVLRRHQLAVAELESHRREIVREIGELQALMRAEREEMRRSLRDAGGGVDAEGARLQAGASMRLALRVQQAALRLAGVEARLSEAREVLRRASIDHRAMERLKEKRFEEWRTVLLRVEAAELDEIGVIRSGRDPGWEAA